MTKGNNMANIDGSKLMCPVHDLDYRIACEHCQEKWGHFSKILGHNYEGHEVIDVGDEDHIDLKCTKCDAKLMRANEIPF